MSNTIFHVLVNGENGFGDIYCRERVTYRINERMNIKDNITVTIQGFPQWAFRRLYLKFVGEKTGTVITRNEEHTVLTLERFSYPWEVSLALMMLRDINYFGIVFNKKYKTDNYEGNLNRYLLEAMNKALAGQKSYTKEINAGSFNLIYLYLLNKEKYDNLLIEKHKGNYSKSGILSYMWGVITNNVEEYTKELTNSIKILEERLGE